jgi:hypothetical protein
MELKREIAIAPPTSHKPTSGQAQGGANRPRLDRAAHKTASRSSSRLTGPSQYLRKTQPSTGIHKDNLRRVLPTTSHRLSTPTAERQTPSSSRRDV